MALSLGQLLGQTEGRPETPHCFLSDAEAVSRSDDRAAVPRAARVSTLHRVLRARAIWGSIRGCFRTQQDGGDDLAADEAARSTVGVD